MNHPILDSSIIHEQLAMYDRVNSYDLLYVLVSGDSAFSFLRTKEPSIPKLRVLALQHKHVIGQYRTMIYIVILAIIIKV